MSGEKSLNIKMAVLDYPGNVGQAVAFSKGKKNFFIGKFFPGTTEERITFGRKVGENIDILTAKQLFDVLFSFANSLESEIPDVENIVENGAKP